MKAQQYPYVNRRKKTIKFCIHNSIADHIILAGSFNEWAPHELQMKPGDDGNWFIEIPLLPNGKYHYRFFIDDRMWMEDIGNQLREPDGVNGFYSVLHVV